MFPQFYSSSDSLRLHTDASLFGIGAVCGVEWFSTPLPPRACAHHINVLELLAMVAAVFVWGGSWRNGTILLHTDNEAVAVVWETGRSRDPAMMKLLRELFFFCAARNLHLIVRHIPGRENNLADALSRLQVSRFRLLLPTAAIFPMSIPDNVWKILFGDDSSC